MSKKLVRLRMTTSSTAIPGWAGNGAKRQMLRLIAAGYAELYEPAEYVTKQEFDALAARVCTEEAAAGKKAKGRRIQMLWPMH